MRYNLFGSKQEVKEIIRFIPKLNKKEEIQCFSLYRQLPEDEETEYEAD